MNQLLSNIFNILQKKVIVENVKTNLTSINDEQINNQKYAHIDAYLKHVEKNLYKFGEKTKLNFEVKKKSLLEQLHNNNLIDLRLFYRSLNFYIYKLYKNETLFKTCKVNKVQKIANLSTELTYYDILSISMVINSVLDTNISPKTIYKLVQVYINNKLVENNTRAYKKVKNISNLSDFNKTTAKDQELKIDKRMYISQQKITLKIITKSIQYFCEHILSKEIELTLFGHNKTTGILNIFINKADSYKHYTYDYITIKNLFEQSLADNYKTSKTA
ncbi:MAG: hypothetical protein EKK57_11475 [Proteobacteria bacterium]|nr:MAG: hypothetical protein EKK57_11475 [Pseudomonadota bacterium]